MRPWAWLCSALALVAFVAVSSLLGLLEPMLLLRDSPFSVWGVWATSVWADVVFVFGMAAVGAAGTVAAARTRGLHAPRIALVGLVVGLFLASWLVYGVAWSLVERGERIRFVTGGVDGPLRLWSYMMKHGWPGLAFSALAPLAAGWWLSVRGWRPLASQIDALEQAPSDAGP